MLFPPSLPRPVICRAFRAGNGELGVLPSDVAIFLDACQADHVEVLGWELWLADHEWNPETKEPVGTPRRWCGLIPIRGQSSPAVVHGVGDLKTTCRELATLDLDALIEPRWAAYVRINFALDDDVHGGPHVRKGATAVG